MPATQSLPTGTQHLAHGGRGIVWLASYPKSGNTWFRIFLRNLLGEQDEPTLDGIGFGLASARETFDDLAGISSSDMTHDEIDSFRPRVYEQIVSAAGKFPVFMKTHDAYTRLANGEPMLSAEATAGAIYLVRNPLDVAVSYAYHSGHENFDRTIAEMSQEHACHKQDRLQNQLRQQMFGWSGHVQHWMESDVPVHVMRYEDMKSDPQETFCQAVKFAGLNYSPTEVASALDASRFDRLQTLEAEHGFREKAPRCRSFFRKGECDSWKESLNDEQVARIIHDHGETMRQFGYL